MSDPLRDAWRAESVKNRRSVAQSLDQGKPERTHRAAVFAVWLGTRQIRRGPKVAAASFLVLVALFIGLRVWMEGRTIADAAADPFVYILAGAAGIIQLFLFNWQVKNRYSKGVAANVAKLEGRSAKAELDVNEEVKRGSDREWLIGHWERLKK